MDNPLDTLPHNPSRELIFEFQGHLAGMLARGEAVAAECPLIHTFSPGVYARSIFIPAGSTLVGKTHRHRHLLIMSQGDVTMTSNEGMRRFQGFNVVDSIAGIKRCVYAHEDTIITTIHLNADDSRDLDVIEADVIIPDALPQIGEST